MSTHSQVGKTVANCPPIYGAVGKLANDCQLEIHTNQDVRALSANWQVGNAAKLPTGRNPHGCWVFGKLQVGEISPSYYVGEGTKVPSVLRGGGLLGRDRIPSGGQQSAVLALDLGTTTGWALHSVDGLITSGAQHFKPQRFEGGGMRYLRFKRWLDEVQDLVASGSPLAGLGAIFFEEVRRHAGVDAAHAYGGFLGQLTAWCEQHQIPYQGVPVGTIKKHATGKGNASKAEMVSAMRQQGFDPADDNEADALAILLWAMQTGQAPQ